MPTPRTTIFASALGIVACAASASDGGLDTTWGADPHYPDGGRVALFYDLGGTQADQAFGAALQDDGRLVIAGSAAVDNPVYGSNKNVAVSRLRADGSVDATFGTLGRFSYSFAFPGLCANEDVAHAVAIRSDGRIVVVGTASCSPDGMGVTSLFVMRLLPNGIPDPDFGSNGVVVQSADNYALGGTAVALFANYAMVAGYVDYGNGKGAPLFWVFDGSGQVVTMRAPFNADAGSRATAISVDSFGDLTISGYYKIAAGVGQTTGYDCFITRLVPDLVDSNYHEDQTFGSGGRVNLAVDDADGNGDDRCFAHAIDSDGRIVIAGEASKDASGGTHALVERFTSAGSRDASFASAGLYTFEIDWNLGGAINSARAVAIRGDNRVVVAGYGSVAASARAPFDFGLLRIDATGGADATFEGSQAGSRPSVAMIGFETSGYGTDDGAFAVALDKANRVYVVGQHQVAGSNYDMAVARLQSDALFIDGFESP